MRSAELGALPDPGAARALATFKKKRGFVGIGAELYALLRRRFRPVDHVAVVRGSRKLAAAEENFFLRGFNHLLVFKKERRRAAGDGR